ncbi:MAG: 4-(cytidine 5'-diphospho)-2-C-methyl-D-erythritol kinase, partial [Sphingobacteriales bacterium]
SGTGLSIHGDIQDNLCLKAFHLLQKDFPQITAQKIHLHKAIPMGAGMGGGSADAAFMLKILNEKFELNLSVRELINYALQLGSDCPFFIINNPCVAGGRGEKLEPIDLDLSAYHILIVNPGIHVNTGNAFSLLTPGINNDDIKILIQQPITEWKNFLTNDFEKPVFVQHPEIAGIKQKMYDNNAVYASMSGSGSTVFGIFNSKTDIKVNFPAHYFCQWV